jgi:hypothetical protein
MPPEPREETTAICKREVCAKEFIQTRKNKDYCSSTCRAEASHERKGQRGSSDAAKKPQRNAAKRRRRQTKDGDGTRLYVVRDEVELVRDLLAGKPSKRHPARERLALKIPGALKRIDRKAA